MRGKKRIQNWGRGEGERLSGVEERDEEDGDGQRSGRKTSLGAKTCG